MRLEGWNSIPKGFGARFDLSRAPWLPTGQTYTAIAAGGAHSVALTSAGKVLAWGNHADDAPTPPIGKAYTAVAASG